MKLSRLSLYARCPYIEVNLGAGCKSQGDRKFAFEDGTGRLKLVSSEALADLFKLFSERVECVVLNACYSEFQAKAIVRHINYVVGMSKAIGDRAAIEFSVGFYTAIGAGESIEFAYQLGCNAIQLEGISEDLTPVLFRKVGSNRVHIPNSESPYYQSGNTGFSPEVTQSRVSTREYGTVDEARSESKRRRERYPLWVKIILWNAHSQSTAWFQFWLDFIVALVFCIAIIFTSGFWSGLCLLAAIEGVSKNLWRWLAIRWVDRNDH